MNTETEWWMEQRQLVERTLQQFEAGEVSLKTLADDLMSFSYAFAERGTANLADFVTRLEKSPAEWLEDFQSAAFGVEVIFSVAVDRGWESLPAEEVTALNDEVERLKTLITILPA